METPLRGRTLLLLIAALTNATCGSGRRPTLETVEAVPTVFSQAPHASESWGSLGDEPLLFFSAPQATTVTRLADGRWVAASLSTDEIVFLTADGLHQRTIGGLGVRPYGFRSLAKLWRMQGDSLLVADRLPPGEGGNYRILVISPEGRLVREWRLPSTGGGQPMPVCLVGGRLLFAMEIRRVPRGTAGRIREGVTGLVYRLDGTEVARRSGFAGREVEAAAGRQFRRVFHGKTGCWACGESQVWFGDSERFAALELDTLLNSVRRVERSWDPRPVRLDSPEALTLGMAAGVRPRDSVDLGPVAIASVYPAIERLVDLGAAGLWVAAYPLPGSRTVTWSVFGRDGRWTGDIELPPHFVPQVGAGDSLAAIVEFPDGRPAAALWKVAGRPVPGTASQAVTR